MRSVSPQLPQAESDQLVALFNTGQLVELESRSQFLLKRYPTAGFIWKVLSLALHAQGKEALPELQKAADLLPDDAEAQCNLGAVLKHLGHLDSAVASYRRALRINPDDAGISFNLGITLQALGQLDNAVLCFRRVIAINPMFSEAYLCLGNALIGLGQLEQAVASYHQALEISPDYAEAHNNLGKALTDLGQYENAVTSCRRALEIQPDFTDAHLNLGNALIACGHQEDAVATYRRVIAIKPDSARAHNNLGLALSSLKQLDAAVASYHQAIDIEPDYVEAHCNLGNALEEIGQLDDAVNSYRQALAIKPEFIEAMINLGNALEAQGQFAHAVTIYRQALNIEPHCVDALSNLGHALINLNQFDDAATCCRQALEIKPDFFHAHSNLGNALLNLGQFDQALSSFLRAQEIKADSAEGHSNLLFLRNYLSSQSVPILLSAACRFGELAALQARQFTNWRNAPNSNRRLRVGLVSGDLGIHPVGYFVESILAALTANAADQVELIAYPSFIRDDELAVRLKSLCHDWHPSIGLTDEKLAERIREDGIDILVDLSGHTAHNRLLMFAWKPAPIQISWLGYFASTGIAAMDYLLADPWTAPTSEEAHFTEKIWRMPETYLCFTPPNIDVKVAPLPAMNNGYVTFGCFNNLIKMNDAVVALWARVLRHTPESRLFLKTSLLEDGNMQQSVVNRFAAHGISAERLILEGPAPRAELLAAYNRIDIALDPFPYPGGTTSVEALWMGVPVLTLAGDRFLSHIGESILQNAGLPDWIAADADDYVRRAATHANDIQRLATLRNSLRQQMLASPLFDAPRFARHFETALRGMWALWCQQQQEKSP